MSGSLVHYCEVHLDVGQKSRVNETYHFKPEMCFLFDIEHDHVAKPLFKKLTRKQKLIYHIGQAWLV